MRQPLIVQKESEKRGNQPFDVLNGGGQEALFAYVTDAEHAGIVKTVIDFEYQ